MERLRMGEEGEGEGRTVLMDVFPSMSNSVRTMLLLECYVLIIVIEGICWYGLWGVEIWICVVHTTALRQQFSFCDFGQSLGKAYFSLLFCAYFSFSIVFMWSIFKRLQSIILYYFSSWQYFGMSVAIGGLCVFIYCFSRSGLIVCAVWHMFTVTREWEHWRAVKWKNLFVFRSFGLRFWGKVTLKRNILGSKYYSWMSTNYGLLLL